jgi:HrpA-like RNA helicase
MPLPTLLTVGTIIPQKWMTKEQKQKAESMQADQWLAEYLIDRSWNRKAPPRVRIQSPGSRVGVFRASTGTGKSTVLPYMIYKTFFEVRGVKKSIICTEPSIATAVDIPFQLIRVQSGLRIGDNIGYQTGAVKLRPIKGLLYATIGILLQQLKTNTDEDFMKKYSFIIIDEVHNLSIEAETTLFYLRRFLERNYKNPDCPYIILTSGTFEPEPLLEFFDCPADSFIDIKGVSYPIVDNYAQFDVSDYISYVLWLVEKIHLENEIKFDSDEFRDILIFVQGGAQIKELVHKLHILNATVFGKGLDKAKQHLAATEAAIKKGGAKDATRATSAPSLYICPIAITSESMQKTGDDYRNLYSNINTVRVPIYKLDSTGKMTDKISTYAPVSRRVIIATNAIETGMTIDTLKYCIDTGFVNELQFNPNFGVNMLLNKPVTQASAKQRRGRVGRKHPGEFYACYTESTFKALQPMPHPDIIKSDITMALLDMIINETDTYLYEVGKMPSTKSRSDAFQMNKFDQRWYALDRPKQFNLSNMMFLNSPSSDSFKFSLEKLRALVCVKNAQVRPRKHTHDFSRLSSWGECSGSHYNDLLFTSRITQIRH